MSDLFQLQGINTQLKLAEINTLLQDYWLGQWDKTETQTPTNVVTDLR